MQWDQGGLASAGRGNEDGVAAGFQGGGQRGEGFGDGEGGEDVCSHAALVA